MIYLAFRWIFVIVEANIYMKKKKVIHICIFYDDPKGNQNGFPAFLEVGTRDVWRLLRGATTDRFNSRATISRQTWQGSPTELLRGGSHFTNSDQPWPRDDGSREADSGGGSPVFCCLCFNPLDRELNCTRDDAAPRSCVR